MTESATMNPGTVKSLQRSLPRRLQATGIHFALSAVIFVAALYLILVHWYPGFHFTVDGGWQGVRIMAAVDFVLGPMLTLIIFNPFKARRLIVFDLTCIGLTQLGALVWGFYAIHSQHPVSVNFHDGRFHSMTAAPLRIEKAEPDLLAKLSSRLPALVYVAPPANEGEEMRAAMQEIIGRVAAHEDPLFFRPFAPRWADIRKRALNPARHASEDPPFARELPGFLERHSGQPGDYAFFPYTGRYGQCTLAFTTAGELVDALGCEKI